MEQLKHSGVGIASFVTCIVSSILIFLLFIIAGAMEESTPRGVEEESTSALVLGSLLITLEFASVVALGLGIGGLLQKERKKIFAILGALFSAVTLVGTISFMIL